MSRGLRWTELPPKVRDRYAQTVPAAKLEPRLVPKHGSRQPNKTEAEFASRYLEMWRVAGAIASYGYESVTLKLANDCRLTPDWNGVDRLGRTFFWECKGPHAEEDSIIKLKLAARLFPHYEFSLCRRHKGGEWTIVRVLP